MIGIRGFEVLGFHSQTFSCYVIAYVCYGSQKIQTNYIVIEISRYKELEHQNCVYSFRLNLCHILIVEIASLSASERNYVLLHM